MLTIAFDSSCQRHKGGPSVDFGFSSRSITANDGGSSRIFAAVINYTADIATLAAIGKRFLRGPT